MSKMPTPSAAALRSSALTLSVAPTSRPRVGFAATIDRGRTNNVLGNGDDMPTWGQLYGGPLTDQQINDIIDWLQTIQRPVSAASSS